MRGVQSWQGTLLYHMSKQRFFELPGLENPSLKLPAADTMASPWLIDWVVFMVSTAMVIVVIGNKAEEKRSMGMPFSDNPMILFFFLEVHFYFNGYLCLKLTSFFFFFGEEKLSLFMLKTSKFQNYSYLNADPLHSLKLTFIFWILWVGKPAINQRTVRNQKSEHIFRLVLLSTYNLVYMTQVYGVSRWSLDHPSIDALWTWTVMFWIKRDRKRQQSSWRLKEWV
jgi:hypothetical protein